MTTLYFWVNPVGFWRILHIDLNERWSFYCEKNHVWMFTR